EPDMWGYGEHAASKSDAATVPVARVGNLAGLARAVVRMRNKLAPNVLLAYHASDWGTGVDLTVNDPSPKQTDALAAKAARFYRSLKAKFDVTFTDWSDRDAGFKQAIYGAGADATTCACDARGDGVTNPAPINGNARRSYSADDDGGYFRHRARAYYARPLRLP